MTTQPTPYPDVNAVLDVLVPEIRAILGDAFTGMYLYGSLVYGGFDQDSDVDFVVVTQGELPQALFLSLQAMHARIATLDSWCATQLEGTYLPQHALQHYDPLRALHVHIDRGPGETLRRMQIDNPLLSRAWWGGWVLLRAALLEKGMRLAGADIHTLVSPVAPEDLRQASNAILEGWAATLLEHPAEIASQGYQSYTVLTLCRILYTLENAAVASKPDAALWAQGTLGQPWAALIELAWAGRHKPAGPVSPEQVRETLAFIRFMLDYGNRVNYETIHAQLPRRK
jgi:hypothetical protein